MPSPFFERFRRITYSTSYLPEIDGLRFIAIFSVVLIMHISHYLDDKFFNHHIDISNGYWSSFIYEGGNGVPLFFVISGFIVSLPFARSRILNQRKVSLKNYFLRRIFRLEPPYIIALTLLFIGHVWVLHQYSFANLLPHFFASAFYAHGPLYESISPIMPVAWSLEVEVQFYILAPIFCSIFLIRRRMVRWVISGSIIVISSIAWFDVWTLGHVFMYLHYFFCGILLTDFFCCNVRLFKNEQVGFFAGVCALAGYFFIPSIHLLFGYLLKLVCIFILVHTVLTNQTMKRIFSMWWMVLIGGMCYSIYLLHFAIVSVTGQLLMYTGLNFSNPLYLVPLAMVIVVVVVIVAAVFFLLVEKPFMKPVGLRKKEMKE